VEGSLAVAAAVVAAAAPSGRTEPNSEMEGQDRPFGLGLVVAARVDPLARGEEGSLPTDSFDSDSTHWLYLNPSFGFGANPHNHRRDEAEEALAVACWVKVHWTWKTRRTLYVFFRSAASCCSRDPALCHSGQEGGGLRRYSRTRRPVGCPAAGRIDVGHTGDNRPFCRAIVESGA
jgi:hypothetical protein